MTVIAWDGETLAADKLASYGGMRCTVTKIHRVGSVLVGGAGDVGLVNAMIEWVRAGRGIASFPGAQADKVDYQPMLVIEADGTQSLYERSPYPVRHEQKHSAIGSGREYARAAMYLGRSALEAVNVACALDCECGGGVDTLTLDGKPD